MANQSNPRNPSERRRLIFESPDHQEQTRVVVDEIKRRQNQNPRLFLCEDKPVVVVLLHGKIHLKPLTARRLKAFAQTEAQFFKLKKIKGDLVPVPVNLSIELCEHILSKDDIDQWMPPLERILCSPVFDPEGNLCADQGYHKGLKAWLELDFELALPENKPTSKQSKRALEIIEDEFLGDFPFVDKASKAHAIALGLLPFVRPMIQGPTPLHLVTAPVPRTGKTKLVISLALGTTGALPSMCPPSSDEEEWRKKITSTLIRYPQIVLIDNLPTNKPMDNSYLASVLTLDTWEDRILGASENIKLPNSTAWAATGNNPSMTSELVDRSAWIQLDPKVPDPSQRGGFKHEQIEQWTKEHRPMLCLAFLTLVQNWIVKGKPQFKKRRLGGFESWAQTIGGILEAIGVEGFLINHKILKLRSDNETNEWGGFVSTWWNKFSAEPLGVAELFNLCEANDLLNQVRGSNSERSQRIKLGRALSTQLDRTFETEISNEPTLLRLERVGTHRYTKTKLYRLQVQKNQKS